MSIKTLELHIEAMKLQKELNEQKHKQIMERLEKKREIAQLNLQKRK